MLLSSSKRSKESQSLLEDMYGDDIFHIYGIWEVKLSKEFEQELFYSEDWNRLQYVNDINKSKDELNLVIPIDSRFTSEYPFTMGLHQAIMVD